ncbi:PXA domain-containing protein [Hygrophoropsis aurantiaca]|uniref:PXA domain-containing protein n=1 Tax=Hygrophoropsis aurantiaca TaxID=72124 RepID=A0ACB8AHA8_9AGAM|nr:PXA domain-containing protein [Hygrophoropsis aurantiaca]
MAAKSRPQLARSPRSVVSVSSNNTTQKQQPASLAKRLLFPQLPPGSNLPPLFASLLCPPELNEEAYDFLALALRAFVNTWWSKITRYDKELLPEIASIITLVVRRLEARLLAVDLSQVVFSDIPALLTQHYIDYRHASAKVSTSYAAGGAASLPQLFHQLQPHMALSSDGRINEEYFRQAFDLVLKACLSPEDYAPDPERFIIREIILKVLLRDVIPKITQPWFIQRTLLDLLGPTQDVEPEKSSEFTVPIPPTSFSFHTVIVFFLSAIQSISGTCLALIHAYKQMVNTIKLVNQSAPPRPPAQTQPSSHPTQAPSPPRPIHLSIRTNSGRSTSPLSSSYASAASSTSSLHPHPASHQPSSTVDHSPNDYARQLFSLVSEIFTMQDRFASSTILHTINVMFAFSSAFVNRLLTHMLYTHALSPPSMLTVLRLSKRTLFPNGYPGPPPADPSPEEQFIIRQQLTKRIRECMPSIAMSLALGPSPSATLDAAIDPLSDAACNSHLIVLIIDALLLTIFPEMGVEGTAGTNKGDVTREDWVPEDISRTSSANS